MGEWESLPHAYPLLYNDKCVVPAIDHFGEHAFAPWKYLNGKTNAYLKRMLSGETSQRSERFLPSRRYNFFVGFTHVTNDVEAKYCGDMREHILHGFKAKSDPHTTRSSPSLNDAETTYFFMDL